MIDDRGDAYRFEDKLIRGFGRSEITSALDNSCIKAIYPNVPLAPRPDQKEEIRYRNNHEAASLFDDVQDDDFA